MAHTSVHVQPKNKYDKTRDRTVFTQSNTAQLGNNDLGLHDTSFIALYIQWYQRIFHKGRPLYGKHKSISLGYKDIATHPFQHHF
jgi:hypothetical protein